MALDPITAGVDLANTIVSRIWPDKTQEEQQQLAAVLSMVQGQMQIDQAEASNPNFFVAGARPAIIWICGAGCGWNWIGLPVATFLMTALGHPINVAPADITQMLPLLMGMLGFGGMHMYENIQTSKS